MRKAHRTLQKPELLGFLVRDMLTAKLAELLNFEFVLLLLLVTSRHIVAPVALTTCQRNIVAHWFLLRKVHLDIKTLRATPTGQAKPLIAARGTINS